MDNWLIEQEIDLQRGAQAPQVWPNALMLCGDNNAHTWRVTVLDGGEAAQVTGSAMGYFVRPDGNTVAVQGSMTGNVASVVLAQACYAQEGDVKAVLRLSVSTGAKVTLAALILPVRNVLTDSIIDPGNVIPSLDDLLAQIASMEQLEDDISSAESARVTAEQGRVTAEQGRVTAEQGRVTAETARANAEDDREEAEADRVSAEQGRVTAETARANAEDDREEAETARVNAEDDREEAETDRATAEQGRATAEQGRVTAEQGRVSAEQQRVAAENERAALGFSVVDGALCVTYNKQEEAT